MADLLEVDRRRGLFRMDGRGFCHGGCRTWLVGGSCRMASVQCFCRREEDILSRLLVLLGKTPPASGASSYT
jgi:hypothetical protein